jgi:hypothetical protein
MSRGYVPDEYDLERQHEIERRLDMAREQEPEGMHQPHRNRFLARNRPGPERRYFSRLMWRPTASMSTAVAAENEAA